MTRIRNKRQMYEMLQAGRFGNFCRLWHSLEEVLASDYTGLVSIRSLQTTNPIRLYHVPIAELAETVAKLPVYYSGKGLTFCESPPDDKRTIQGEIMRDEWGYRLHYSFALETMRIALETAGRWAQGLEAKLLLETYLEPVDFDELQLLLDMYPGAAIEFTGFRVPVGVIPHRKMIVWEVRHY